MQNMMKMKSKIQLPFKFKNLSEAVQCANKFANIQKIYTIKNNKYMSKKALVTKNLRMMMKNNNNLLINLRTKFLLNKKAIYKKKLINLNKA